MSRDIASNPFRVLLADLQDGSELLARIRRIGAEIFADEPWRFGRICGRWLDLSAGDLHDAIVRQIQRAHYAPPMMRRRDPMLDVPLLQQAQAATELDGFAETWRRFQNERNNVCVRVEFR